MLVLTETKLYVENQSVKLGKQKLSSLSRYFFLLHACGKCQIINSLQNSYPTILVIHWRQSPLAFGIKTWWWWLVLLFRWHTNVSITVLFFFFYISPRLDDVRHSGKSCSRWCHSDSLVKKLKWQVFNTRHVTKLNRHCQQTPKCKFWPLEPWTTLQLWKKHVLTTIGWIVLTCTALNRVSSGWI